MTETQEIVFKMISSQLGVHVEEISLESRFIGELGADSMAAVELIMAFEERFGIEIYDEDAEIMNVVGDIVNYIASKVMQKAA